jgi:hypothetical protein
MWEATYGRFIVCHVIGTHVYIRLLIHMASYDVTSNIWRALVCDVDVAPARASGPGLFSKSSVQQVSSQV